MPGAAQPQAQASLAHTPVEVDGAGVGDRLMARGGGGTGVLEGPGLWVREKDLPRGLWGNASSGKGSGSPDGRGPVNVEETSGPRKVPRQH